VDDDEVHRVVESWKQLGEPNYLESIVNGVTENEMLPGIAGADEASDAEDSDPLYDEAVSFVTESRRASISAVQRKLRIGYNRAARMIETMEAAGVVSEMGSNGSREVLANAPPQ
jgi:S-DNA-T family DNA segregation ATPase FtsK/SpoIIIE